MGPRALAASPGLAPWSMTVSENRMKNVARHGGQEGQPPWAESRLRGILWTRFKGAT